MNRRAKGGAVENGIKRGRTGYHRGPITSKGTLALRLNGEDFGCRVTDGFYFSCEEIEIIVE